MTFSYRVYYTPPAWKFFRAFQNWCGVPMWIHVEEGVERAKICCFETYFHVRNFGGPDEGPGQYYTSGVMLPHGHNVDMETKQFVKFPTMFSAMFIFDLKEVYGQHYEDGWEVEPLST